MDIYEALDKLKQNKRIDRTARRKQLVEKKLAESSDKKPVKKSVKKLNESVTGKKSLKESRVNVIYFARAHAGYGNSIDSPEFDNVEDAIVYAVLNGYDEIVKCTYYGTLDTNPDYDSDKLEDAQRKYGIYVDYKRFKTEDELLAFLNDNEDYQGATDEYSFFDAYKLTRQKNESLKERVRKTRKLRK